MNKIKYKIKNLNENKNEQRSNGAYIYTKIKGCKLQKE